ncbi:hypothetical protein WDU94_007516 [Cyamophila willieti]
MMQSQLVILGLSLFSLTCWSGVRAEELEEFQGANVCTRNEAYQTTIKVSEVKPIQIREYKWCLAVPPQCSKYRLEYKTVYHDQIITKTRLVHECCKGYTIDHTGKRIRKVTAWVRTTIQFSLIRAVNMRMRGMRKLLVATPFEDGAVV